MGKIAVGAVIKKDNKYLLVQEKQENCRGKWNPPIGKLDPNETVFEGTIREVQEESGFKVKLTGIVNIANRVVEDDEFLGIIFATEILEDTINYDKNEILDVKWFTYDEILKRQNELRSSDWMVDAITRVESNKISSLDLIKIIK